MSTRRSPFAAILRSAGLPALALISMGFFGYYAVMGPNGLLIWPEYKHQLEARNAEYAKLDKQRGELRNRVQQLDPKRGANPDMVDELVRKQLNVVRDDEVVVPLNK